MERRSVEVRCLGQPQVWVRGQPVALGPEQRVTLSVLAAAGPTGLTKTELYEELFARRPQKSREQTAVMRVRRLREKLATVEDLSAPIDQGARFALNPSVCIVDIWEFDLQGRESFTALAELLRKWDEPFRDLSDIPDSVRISAERLRSMYRGALAKIGWLLHDDADREILDLVLQELELAPFDEALTASASIALYRSGQQTEALARINAYRKLLMEGHGLDPGPRINELEHAILQHDVEPIGQKAIDRVSQSGLIVNVSEPEKFVGRVQLQQELVAAVNEMRSASIGDPGPIRVLRGPAGSGKSTMLTMLFAQFGSMDVHLRIGSASADGTSTPYAPFFEAFPSLVDDVSTDNGKTTEQIRLGIWKLVHEAICSSAEVTPLVLVLEDMHEADSQTIALWRFLRRSFRPGRLMIILSTREPLPHSAWAEDLLADEDRDDLVVHDLEPLDGDSLRQLVDLDHPAQTARNRERFARALEQHSAGNALVASILSRDAGPNLETVIFPESVVPERAYSEHLSRTVSDRSLEQVLAVAAMVGATFNVSTVASALGLEPHSVDTTLRRAAEKSLVYSTGPGSWRFDHLLTVAHFSQTLGLLRPMLFARLAQLGSPNPRQLLRYIQGAGGELDDEFVVARLGATTSAMERHGAFAESVAAWTVLCRRTPPRSEQQFEAEVGRAGALSRAGALEEAKRQRASAANLARELDLPSGRFRAALAGLPSGEYVSGEQDRLQLLMSATDNERASVDPAEFARWNLRLARLCDETAIADDVIATIDTDWANGDPVLWTALELEVLNHNAQRREADSILSALTALADVTPSGEQRAELMHSAVVAAITDQRPSAEVAELAEQTRALVRVEGSPRIRWASDVLATTLTIVGFHDVHATAATARTSGHRWGIPDVDPTFSVQFFLETWLAGAVDLAESAIDSVWDELAMNVGWEAALALSAAANGNLSRSSELVAKVGATLQNNPDDAWSTTAAALLAETAVILGSVEAAQVAEHALIPRTGQAIVMGIGVAHLGPVDRYLSLTATLTKRCDPGELEALAIQQAVLAGATRWADYARANSVVSDLRFHSDP